MKFNITQMSDQIISSLIYFIRLKLPPMLQSCYNSMPPLCPIEKLKESRELVICDSENSRLAHKEIFHFSDEVYILSGEQDNVFDTILLMTDTFNEAPATGPSRIHIVLRWENILRVSSWKLRRPDVGDVFLLLKNSGVSAQELQPFKTADINDLFPWLYYGKRLGVLRKICHAAKRQMEGRLKNHTIRVDGHLIADDTKQIVASSL